MISRGLFGNCLLVIFLSFTTPTAYAYIDPGTGSLLIQGLLAAIAGVFVTIKLYWYRIRSFLGFADKADPEDRDDETNG